MRRRRGFYEKLAIGGFLLFPLTMGVLGLVLLAIGQKTPAGVLAMLTAVSVVDLVAGVALLLTNRFLIPSLVLAVFILFASSVIGTFGLPHPDSFFDFFTSLLLLIGPLAVIVGSSVALVERRRGNLRDAKPIERAVVMASTLVLLALGVVLGVRTLTQTADAAAPKGAILVETSVDTFMPSTLRVDASGLVRVFVVNHDRYAHTFTIDALGVDEYIGPTAHRLITFRIPAKAMKGRDRREFELACDVTGHEFMTGTIVASR